MAEILRSVMSRYGSSWPTSLLASWHWILSTLAEIGWGTGLAACASWSWHSSRAASASARSASMRASSSLAASYPACGESLQQLQLLVATVPQRGDFGLLGGATHGEVVLTC